MKPVAWMSAWVAVMMLAAMPAGTSFQLNSFGFGTGGTADSGSTNYRYNAMAGEAGGRQGGTNYKVRAGETYIKEANVPTVTLVNASFWYNRLDLTIGPQGNPSDAKYAVAISTDNFVTTQYVKADFTVGSTLTSSDYLTCAGWGVAACGGPGYVTVRGLFSNMIYTAEAKAIRGKYTESPYGPVSAATTTDLPSLTFDIDISATDLPTDPPYQIDFGNLLVSTVKDTPKRVWITLDTNADSGGKVYLSSQNVGLKSDSSAYMIASLDGDLGTLAEGYGAQGKTATQTSGGPLSLTPPYNGAGSVVGAADTLIREIFTAPAPVTGGRGSFVLKAKTAPLTPASGDYTDILTAIAAASF